MKSIFSIPIALLFLLILLSACNKDEHNDLDAPVAYNTLYQNGHEYVQTVYCAGGFSFKTVDQRLTFSIGAADEIFHSFCPSNEAMQMLADRNKGVSNSGMKYYLVANIRFIYNDKTTGLDAYALTNIRRINDWRLVIGRLEEYVLAGKIYDRLVVVEDVCGVPPRVKPEDPTGVDNSVSEYEYGQRYIQTFTVVGGREYDDMMFGQIKQSIYSRTLTSYKEFECVRPSADMVDQMFEINDNPRQIYNHMQCQAFLTADIGFTYGGGMSNLELKSDWELMRVAFDGVDPSNSSRPVLSFIDYDDLVVKNAIIGKWQCKGMSVRDSAQNQWFDTDVVWEFNADGQCSRTYSYNSQTDRFNYIVQDGNHVNIDGVSEIMYVYFDRSWNVFYSSDQHGVVPVYCRIQ